MKKLRLYNTITGWVIFLVAAYTYLSTLEPTGSLWDCGEFIASAYKLQVGHPPGAPLFMIAARLFTLFAGGDTSRAAIMVNGLSGLASAFTVLFLFWSISHFAIKILKPGDDIKPWQYIAILGSAAVGALTYTFTDSFWFSAVEGEVYASSALFTSLVFWSILKWENVSDEKYANRWLILIAYLMGLSIGVHLLNLLAIPAIVLVYYFKKYTPTRNGVIAAVLISFLILGGIMYVIIPGVVWVASIFELLFVNGFHLPYNSGVLFYAALLIGGLIWGIIYTHRKGKVLANTIILVISVIILGYSCFSMTVIRSLADPPMNENNPSTVFNLMYYLNREQYGQRPLLYGQYFNAQPIKAVKGTPTYNQENGRYVITSRQTEYKYDPAYETIFPRMYSSDRDHIDAYLEWAGIKKKDVYNPVRDKNGDVRTDRNGKVIYDYNSPRQRPSFMSNIRFFWKYQLGFMYFRYFMWNFVGRQNDKQGYGGPLYGNWISGVPPVDYWHIGEKTRLLPPDLKHEKSRNVYYGLPFLLGLIGLFYHLNRRKKDFWIVMLLFFMTGIAIVLYLNQTPLQPRERDYAYAGSFYAYAIWVGLGVMAIIDLIGKRAKNIIASSAITAGCLALVPAIMAKENWKDHDRSGRYTTRDIAADYLESCAPNAILFTNGDNDTFPLWYDQEVEGIRTDVRVVNLMLLNMDWYIDQMKRKEYGSEPLPITLKNEQYINGTRDAVYVYPRFKEAYDIKDILNFITQDGRQYKLQSQDGGLFNYVPTRKFYVPVDKKTVLENGTVSVKDSSLIVNRIEGTLKGSYLTKSDMIVMDIIAHNDWKRPIYFVAASQNSGLLGLDDYLQLDGLAYRLVPIKTVTNSSFEKGRINTDTLYYNFMKKFKYGRMNKPDVYLDNFQLRTLQVVRLRYRFYRLAEALTDEGDTVRAEKVLDKIINLTPHQNVPYDMFMPSIADAYFRIHKDKKANKIMDYMLNLSDSNLTYYMALDEKVQAQISDEINYNIRIFGNAMQMARKYNQKALQKKAEDMFSKFSDKYPFLR